MDPQLLINGLALGSIIAPAAVGLTLTYGVLRLFNFAHGDFLTLGAYIAWVVNLAGVNISLAIGCGMVATILAMLISEKLLWSPMRKKRASTTQDHDYLNRSGSLCAKWDCLYLGDEAPAVCPGLGGAASGGWHEYQRL